jgi:predicted TIM-barrel fold metal-dependent hydrolase
MKHSVIDADGHVLEDDSLREFIKYPSDGFQANRSLAALFPSLDHHHNGIFVSSKDAFGGGKKVGPAEWGKFCADAGLRYSVLYPTLGLSMGNIQWELWANIVARGYNDWLYHTYTKDNPQLKGVALLPFQDPPEAAKELRRAVKELGFLTAMIPANGLSKHLGDKFYWPVYEEAERLGVPLAVHGGNHSNYGMDGFTVYTPINGLGHPFGQMVAFSSLVFHGVFDEFPSVRFAFLEAGSAWVGLWMDRMDRSYQYHVDLDGAGKRITLKEKLPSNYFKTGRVFVGCEGSERSLPGQIKLVGNELFLFASDFPHEVSAKDCIHEIEEIEEADDLTDADKAAVLYKNAERFYGFKGAEVASAVR